MAVHYTRSVLVCFVAFLSVLLFWGCEIDDDVEDFLPSVPPRLGPRPGPGAAPVHPSLAPNPPAERVPALPGDLANQSFTFVDGAAFGLAGREVTLTIGNVEAFLSAVLVEERRALTGQILIDGSGCTFVIETSSLITLAPNSILLFNPCEVDMDGRLFLVNMDTGARSTSD
jgi:hypothetical protein